MNCIVEPMNQSFMPGLGDGDGCPVTGFPESWSQEDCDEFTEIARSMVAMDACQESPWVRLTEKVDYSQEKAALRERLKEIENRYR